MLTIRTLLNLQGMYEVPYPPPLIIFILLINWGIKTNGMKKRDGGKTASTPEMFSLSTGKKNLFTK